LRWNALIKAHLEVDDDDDDDNDDDLTTLAVKSSPVLNYLSTMP
jgi:hypothetical protein